MQTAKDSKQFGGKYNPLFLNGDIMKELLQILNFNCKMERFAEVFGDDIEMSDIKEFIEIAPLTLGDFLKYSNPATSEGIKAGDPDNLFFVLDMLTQSKLIDLRKAEGFEPADLRLLEVYFRFVNDAFGWGDLADLERWETDLFDALNGYQQKNYEPLSLSDDYASRSALLDNFIEYIARKYGDAVASDCIQLLGDYFREFVTMSGGF